MKKLIIQKIDYPSSDLPIQDPLEGYSKLTPLLTMRQFGRGLGEYMEQGYSVQFLETFSSMSACGIYLKSVLWYNALSQWLWA